MSILVFAAACAAACGRSSLDDDLLGTSGATGMTGSTGTGASGASGTVSGATGISGTITGATGISGTITGASGSVSGASGVSGTISGATGGSGTVPPTCGPENCAGCCAGVTCNPGTSLAECGAAGQACQACPTGDTCSGIAGGGRCAFVSQCPLTCQGCCDPNGQCQAGFLDALCGQQGAACTNCTALSPPSTCDTNSMPRVCTSQQTQCPAPYPSCAAGITAPVPTVQHVCSASDLQNAAAACSSSAHTPGCENFFQIEQTQNSACASCLTPFDFDFSELDGLIACLSPFVGAPCSHDLGCLNDCENRSCAMCGAAAATAQCRTEASMGACSGFVNGAACINAAFFVGGAFCNPLAVQGQFGAWLERAGAHYCEE